MRALVTLGMAALLATAVEASAQQQKQAPQAAPAAAPSVTGTILETMDSGGYTYMKLKTDKGEIWSAVNQSKVKKGQTVTIATPMFLDNFQSKTLNRTFDHIIFGTLAGSSAAAPQGAAAASSGGELPPGHPSTGGATRETMAAQHSAAASPQADATPIKVARADGPTGKTVAELYAQRTTLKDKEVAVRGKVVKVTPEVMGKNWLHLHDGTGSAAKKDNDITVTTSGLAAVGDVVLVKGVVHLDRDFGAGYTYSVIIEDAKVSK
jgi:membrane protein implicated in regulation of membrane protease activity